VTTSSLVVLRTYANQYHLETTVPYERAELAKIGAALRVVQCLTSDEVVAAGQDAAAIIHPTNVVLSRRVLERLPQCRGIVVTKVGADNIDVAAATARGIIVANLPDGWTNEVADQAMGLLLAVNRQIVTLHNDLGGKGWGGIWAAPPAIPALRFMTLGLAGFGRIGRAMAKRAQAFGLTVIAYDPLVERDIFAQHGVEQVEFTDLLERSDIVSLHVSLNDRTRHLIGEAALRRMRPGAILINTARGPVVDEAALVRALREGWIAGAGLDVFEQEPFAPDNPLLGLRNVVLTPHSSGLSKTAPDEQRIKCVADVMRILCGRPPRPEAFVNPEVWTQSTVREA